MIYGGSGVIVAFGPVKPSERERNPSITPISCHCGGTADAVGSEPAEAIHVGSSPSSDTTPMKHIK